MLQATEYTVRDYLVWYHRTKDFAHVERRRQFVKTPKAILLLTIALVFILLLWGGAIWVFFIATSPLRYMWALLILFLSPYVVAYGMVIPLLAIRILIQWPLESLILRRARERLQAHKAVKIGIAGSFGKTTMREILKAVLSEGRRVAAPPHSYNTPLGISRFVKTLKGDEEILIFEFGEYYPGDVTKLCDLVRPSIGIITGVNEAHLEKFKSLERTTKTIYELADYLGKKPMYVNGENERARNNARPVHTVYSRESVGEWKIENQKTDLTGTAFTLVKNNTRLELASGLLGLHQIGPLAAACDIARSLGSSPADIRSGVSKTKPFSHRLEPRGDSAGVITLDDSYNGNPDGVQAAIDFLASLKDCRRWYVTPGLVEMGIRTREVHREIGRSLARARIEKVVLIKNSVTSSIEEGLREEGYRGDTLWFDDALAAYAALPHLTAKGDVALLQNDWPDQYQ
ncbi:MAG: UDP-N-acetylmuramoyl-tripeptide--D-alanyl-D-alanine ligase [Candidatus Sungbacteria bacterium]|uniref:UDP-N-acetylmuramoyl-tripeptide--D-alanyl-D-alanine ligase n=1 Tax=Candidatus Sungiibacteriota bacterium TaxID=2750080 RepID=A0A932QYT1_9BACT|nr:UDP-N-acetylmuramoyl-tripeptide--D-alanyl-D-alanine ligase [Candidatus Sungbacteria bacterium]